MSKPYSLNQGEMIKNFFNINSGHNCAKLLAINANFIGTQVV